MFRKLKLMFLFVVNVLALNAELPWSDSYQKLLLEKVGEKLPEIRSYPVFQYPNTDHDEAKTLENGKILLFGYGSLMSPEIDANKKSIKPEDLKTLHPAIAFGVKRLFNKRGSVSKKFTSTTLEPNERCFLNLVPTTNFNDVTNGVTIEIDQGDLIKLIAREVGYDLVPIFVASWNDAVKESNEIEIEIAYTFIASSGLRDHVSYTSNTLYPIRWYVGVVEKAAKFHGQVFWKQYQKSTWLADGSTLISDWHDTFDTPLNIKD